MLDVLQQLDQLVERDLAEVDLDRHLLRLAGLSAGDDAAVAHAADFDARVFRRGIDEAHQRRRALAQLGFHQLALLLLLAVAGGKAGDLFEVVVLLVERSFGLADRRGERGPTDQDHEDQHAASGHREEALLARGGGGEPRLCIGQERAQLVHGYAPPGVSPEQA